MKWHAPLIQAPLARSFVICAYNDDEIYFQVRKELSVRFGLAEYETDVISATLWKSAYQLSFLHLRILCFDRLIKREELVDFRKQCIQIETRFQKMGSPQVEIDPGYVTSYTVVHTTIQETFHSIYLYGGIFAETLYCFEGFSFRPAYVDLQETLRKKEVLAAFNDIRTIYLTDR